MLDSSALDWTLWSSPEVEQWLATLSGWMEPGRAVWRLLQHSQQGEGQFTARRFCKPVTGTGPEAVARGTASEAAPYAEWRQGSGMSECLHCEINQLVQQRMESGHTDLAEIVSMMVESLADLVLLAPESEQPKLMAYALTELGQAVLDKSGPAEEGSTATH
jgi:hypothetical protein